MAVVAIISLAVVIGAVIQGSIGFGYALVSVPAMVLLLPWAVPVTPLFLALPMTLLMSAREWRSIDLSGFWCIIRISPILSYAFVPLGYTVICCRLGVRISTPSSDTNSGTITFLTGLSLLRRRRRRGFAFTWIPHLLGECRASRHPISVARSRCSIASGSTPGRRRDVLVESEKVR